MPVHSTGFSGEAVVPCSHCNANEDGPEAGICHRNPSSAMSSLDRPALDASKRQNVRWV